MDEYEPMPRPVKIILSIIVIVTLLIVGQNFAITLKYSKISDQRKYAQRHPVIVQVCLPDRVVKFENVVIDMSDVSQKLDTQDFYTRYQFVHKPDSTLANRHIEYPTVRKWVYNPESNGTWFRQLNGMVVEEHGMGSAVFSLIGNTISNQPVYDYEWRTWLDNLRGLKFISWSGESANDSMAMRYWFVPPQHIPKNQFTEWQRPVLFEAEQERYSQIDTALMRRERIDPNIDDYKNVPLARYMLAESFDYLLTQRFPERLQWTITMKNYSNITEDQKGKMGFAPVVNDPIPSCDVQKQ